MTKYLNIDYDPDPDLSYLDQAEFADTDPSDIVSLLVVVKDEHDCSTCGGSHSVTIDALGGVDMLASAGDWATGRFDSRDSLPEGYLRDLWDDLVTVESAR